MLGRVILCSSPVSLYGSNSVTNSTLLGLGPLAISPVYAEYGPNTAFIGTTIVMVGEWGLGLVGGCLACPCRTLPLLSTFSSCLIHCSFWGFSAFTGCHGPECTLLPETVRTTPSLSTNGHRCCTEGLRASRVGNLVG